MEKVKIIYGEDTEINEFEAYERGYRLDVEVEVDGKRYNVFIISIIRLQQDVESEILNYGFYVPEINMIIVNEVTKKEIEKTVEELYKRGYFYCIENQFEIPGMSMNFLPGINKVQIPDLM